MPRRGSAAPMPFVEMLNTKYIRICRAPVVGHWIHWGFIQITQPNRWQSCLSCLGVSPPVLDLHWPTCVCSCAVTVSAVGCNLQGLVPM